MILLQKENCFLIIALFKSHMSFIWDALITAAIDAHGLKSCYNL